MAYKNPILLIGGARPNFVKIFPIIKELKKNNIEYLFVHTGQHYDYEMSKVFFEEFGLLENIYCLNIKENVVSQVIEKLSLFLVENEINPKYMIVVGDVDSSFAASYVAKKNCIKLIHVEAGLRSFDDRMPEEINRRLIDSVSDILFVSEKSGLKNLIKEGKKDRSVFVGNVMLDSIRHFLPKIKKEKEKKYIFATLHRPSNVDEKENLVKICEIFSEISAINKIIFCVHPRTRKKIEQFNLYSLLENVDLINPLGYIENISMIYNSICVLTDSGGIQEETTYLNVPCLTIRDNTERPITIERGTNTLIKSNEYHEIPKYINLITSGKYKKSKKIKYWDGMAAERIVDTILKQQTGNK